MIDRRRVRVPSKNSRPSIYAWVAEVERAEDGSRRFEVQLGHRKDVIAIMDFRQTFYYNETGRWSEYWLDGKCQAIREYLWQVARHKQIVARWRWELARAAGQNDDAPIPQVGCIYA